jgi:hypothetical protein
MAEGVGFEPTREREPPGGFQDRCLKPLGHPSNYNIFNGLVFFQSAKKTLLATILLLPSVFLALQCPSSKFLRQRAGQMEGGSGSFG